MVDVNFVSGGATFMKTTIYEQFGLWEESFFCYGEEIDLSKKLENSGYKTLVTKLAKVWHSHLWSKENKNSFYFEYYLIERNKFLFFHKYGMHFSIFRNLIIDIVKFPWRLIWFIKVCDFSLGIYYLRGMIAGVFDHKGKPNLKFVK